MGRVTRWIATNLLGGGELKKATWKEAERNLVFAEQRDPDVPDHHMQLANLYRDTHRPELALREVDHVLVLSAVSPMEELVHAEALGLWWKPLMPLIHRGDPCCLAILLELFPAT